jgi:16S rRNA A1518/A1519 N6-dimethyltransferase RsmA/KsgA/DIM1 with predicted DNA glycosylase/AP lyase activity
VCITDRHAFAQFVRVFFQSRRKTVSHIGKTLTSRAEPSASRAVLGPGQSGEHTFLAALDTLGIPHRARPENITTDQWISLFQAGVCPQGAEPL